MTLFRLQARRASTSILSSVLKGKTIPVAASTTTTSSTGKTSNSNNISPQIVPGGVVAVRHLPHSLQPRPYSTMTVDIPKILPSKVAVLPHHGNNNHTNPAASHPNYVKIVEVGPRDGLQNEKTIVPTPTKISLINKLSSTGLRVIEAGAFVSPKWVPQMSDTPQILVHLDKHPTPAVAAAGADGIMYPYLVPNIQGLRRALELGTTNLKEIAIFASASEGFSQRNINCSIAESLVRFRHVLDLAKEKGIRVRGYISMVISCPYDGPTPPAVVADVTQKLLDMGCYEISLGDTNGSGTPATVSALLTTLTSKPYLIPVNKLACHFHDTYNQALVNSMAALYHGIRVFDSSVAGLGGCPYSKGATGNVSTEDLVYFLEGIGFHTGVDLERVSEVGEWISNELGRKNGSKVGPALLTRRRAELEKEKEKERAHHEAEIKL